MKKVIFIIALVLALVYIHFWIFNWAMPFPEDYSFWKKFVLFTLVTGPVANQFRIKYKD